VCVCVCVYVRVCVFALKSTDSYEWSTSSPIFLWIALTRGTPAHKISAAVPCELYRDVSSAMSHLAFTCQWNWGKKKGYQKGKRQWSTRYRDVISAMSSLILIEFLKKVVIKKKIVFVTQKNVRRKNVTCLAPWSRLYHFEFKFWTEPLNTHAHSDKSPQTHAHILKRALKYTHIFWTKRMIVPSSFEFNWLNSIMKKGEWPYRQCRVKYPWRI